MLAPTKRPRGALRAMAAAAALVVVAAGCGDDDDATSGSEPTPETTAPPTDDTGTPSTGPGGGELVLAEPVHLVLLAEVPGESPVASSWANDGFSMAMDEIADAGGIGGQPVEWERIAAPVLDPAASETAVLRAIDADPTAMVGLGSSAQSLQTSRVIGEGGIPLVHMSTTDQVLLTHPDTVGTPFGFLGRPPAQAIASTFARWGLEELGLERPGLVCNNDAYGTNGCNAARAVAEELGVEFAAEVTTESTATDFTSQVLALAEADVDGIIAIIYPNAVPTMYDQLGDNGVDVPFLANTASLTWQNATRDDLSLLYGIDDCAVVADPDPQVVDWLERFRARYGEDPTFQTVIHYDAAYVVADAIERAGSADPQAVRDALATTDWDGICGDYRGEPSQGLLHSQDIVGYGADGPTIVQTFELDDYTFE